MQEFSGAYGPKNHPSLSPQERERIPAMIERQRFF